MIEIPLRNSFETTFLVFFFFSHDIQYLNTLMTWIITKQWNGTIELQNILLQNNSMDILLQNTSMEMQIMLCSDSLYRFPHRS